MSEGETVSDAGTASVQSVGPETSDIKGSTIWRNTLATSGLGLTAEEIDSLKLTDKELLTLGLTADCPTDNSVLTEHVGELYY